MDDRHEFLPTWAQQREAQLQLWVDEHLASLAALQLADLDDPAVLRAIATRAGELAACAQRLATLAGADLEEDALVAAFKLQLADV